MLLTNNFDFSVDEVSEIYRLRWAIESLCKQLKQNFPLHFFYGDSVNAIQIQTCLTLMYYIDFIAFMENPDKTWSNIQAKEALKAPPEPTLFD